MTVAYVLDSDCFIQAHAGHYAFDLCPAFWEAILLAFARGHLISIEYVREELLRVDDPLKTWVEEKAPAGLFDRIDDEAVTRAYRELMKWARASKQYSDAAKDGFARGADAWLIAYAAAKKKCAVVTHEQSAPESVRIIKLPDAASVFGVNCIRPFDMLRTLGVKFELAQQSE